MKLWVDHLVCRTFSFAPAGIVLDAAAQAAADEAAADAAAAEAEAAEEAKKPKKVVYTSRKHQQKKKEDEGKSKVRQARGGVEPWAGGREWQWCACGLCCADRRAIPLHAGGAGGPAAR